MVKATGATAVGLALGLFVSTAIGLAPRVHVPVTGEAGPGLGGLDRAMLAVLDRHRVPGGTLAVAKGGRLVLARGYGWADLRGRRPMRPDDLMGIASVSKALTAVGVMTLVEGGRLGLDDRALPIVGLGPLPGERMDPRVGTITVRQLLNHSAGYKHQPPLDQVARAFRIDRHRLTAEHLIRFELGRPLDYDPGTEQHYSNFAFVVLDQVIARISGEPYAEFMHRRVLGPMGIHRMNLGARGERYPEGWARRYGPSGRELPPVRPIPGGAGGGWVGSSVDLVRFLTAIDGTRGPAFLGEASMRQMLAPPPPPLRPRRENGSHFGLGWDVVRETPDGPMFAKDGGLAGVRSYIGHTPPDIDWAVLMNGGDNTPGLPGEDADAANLIREALRDVAEWPELNLFPKHR